MNLLAFLYLKCLFPLQDSPNHNSSFRSELDSSGGSEELGALCQTPVSRSLAYSLLYRLCNTGDFTNISKLAAVMSDVSSSEECLSSAGLLRRLTSSTNSSKSCYGVASSGHTFTQWSYDPCQLIKDQGVPVGLVNQGATCYMNAFLQQLFQVASFSDGLLALEVGSGKDPDADAGQGAEAEDPNETLLFQLQVLFGYLRLSQKRYYDSLPFCRSFRDYDGQCVSMSEQKDINEFASMLFEKLEHNTLCADLLRRSFGGKLVWQIISTENEYRSEREEPFYMITAEVKDKASLEDSLDLYVTGEMLTGDNRVEDEDAGRKVEALRRCSIRELPPTLIIHFKRFEFDLETLNRKKLNDRITFPLDLNMFPYTEEGVAAKEARRRSSTHASESEEEEGAGAAADAVSYTHLTLPTIYSV